MTDWKNCIGNLYVSYAYAKDVDHRIVKLLELYPFVFDDNYWYWKPNPKGRNKAHRRARMKSSNGQALVKRSPLWTYPTKSVGSEHPKDPCQSKLIVLFNSENKP